MSNDRATRVATGLVVAAVLALGLAGPTRATVLPGPPRNVTAAGGDGFAILAWLPPLDDGGSPITGYRIDYLVYGVTIFSGVLDGAETTRILDEDDWVVNGFDHLVFRLAAVNAVGEGDWGISNEISVAEGAAAPQVTISEVAPSGGTASTDPEGTQPSAANPVITSVTIPPTADGGTLSIAETAFFESPEGFTFLGQEISIHTTAATDAANPIEIVFRVDPALAPVTIFRNGAPITAGCAVQGVASPSPCIASGAGTAEMTVLTAAASTWNIGIPDYAFSGFSSPVDNLPVRNLAKSGRAIPVRFGLGGDQGLNIFAAGYPKSRQVACEAGASLDVIEETTTTGASLSYSSGTDLYQLTWTTDRAWSGTCRELTLRFRDGSEASAIFTFR